MVKLKRFIRDRGMEPSTGVWAQKKHVIEQLKGEDDQQSFDKFLKLPNELQSLVAEWYMDFQGPLETPTTPPLARTNRHLRQLTLPIFYRTQTFSLAYEDEFIELHDGDSVDERSFRLHNEGRLWLSSLTPKHLGCVRSLHLMSVSLDSISIDLDKSKAGFKVTVACLSRGSIEGDTTNKQYQALERELIKMFEKLEWVDGMQRFKMDDIHAIRMDLEAAYVGLDKE